MNRSLSKYRHNMVQPPEIDISPSLWLSSKSIETLGLYPGLQAASDFNKSFLGTQNWIFSFVGHDKNLDYGKYAVFFEGSHTKRKGLIFPFVMDIEDLIQTGYYMNPKAGEELKHLLETEYPNAWENAMDSVTGTAWENDQAILLWLGVNSTTDYKNEFYKHNFFERHKTIFEKMKLSLIDYFLTPADFQKLVSFIVASKLKEKRKENILSYGALMSKLSYLATFGGSTSSIDAFVKGALQEEGLPQQYEMRIPVAVPGKHVIHGSSYKKILSVFEFR